MQTFSLEQYKALRDTAGVRERPEMARIGVAGRDRLTYLHAMLTNDIAALRPGEACYCAYLTPQGRMIADLRVVELGDLALLELDVERKGEVFEKLDQFIFSEDVQLHDLTDTLADVAIIGPRAAGILADMLACEGGPSADALGSLGDLRAARCTFNGANAVLLFTNVLGVPAFDVFIDRAQAVALLGACSHLGATPVELPAVEVLRVEAGVPRFGADMDERTIPLEAGIERRAISFTKGCYPGQEVITRVLHRGHGRVARKLVGIAIDGETVPERGDLLMVDDKEVGQVTSAAMSPLLGCAIALGYAAREHASPGVVLVVEHGGEQLQARVTDLPFAR